jgi:probable phosphoglycerate mutase
MRIYFARHGESQANLLHEISNRGLRHGLTLQGREQALTLARHLQTLSIACIYSSTLLRAVETSILVANQLGLDYEVVDALREFDCGIAEGRSYECGWQMGHELVDAWVVHKRWEQRIEGGESFYDIRDRFVPFIDELISQYGDTETDVLCVSHGGVLRMMLPQILKNVDHEYISKHGLDYTTCIMSEYRAEGLTLVEWNGHKID